MTNMYVFWKLVDDPPSPWSRLTRTNRYLRFDSNTANHWVDVGAATHTHSVTGFSCGNPPATGQLLIDTGSSYYAMGLHQHATSSWSIGNANNTPPGYGLDIIYIDMSVWESQWRRFPQGAMILSDGVLQDAGYLTFSSGLVGKYIVNAEPGTTFGNSDAHAHSVSASTSNANGCYDHHHHGYTGWVSCKDHHHNISLNSGSLVIEPRNLVTRLYEVTAKTSKALAGTVVFVDGSTSANWSILSGWADGNLKIGDSNPTISGSDTHTHSFSGNTSGPIQFDGANNLDGRDGTEPGLSPGHTHPVSGTLASTSHVPQSKYLVPAKLTTTLYAPTAGNRAQIIGLW